MSYILCTLWSSGRWLENPWIIECKDNSPINISIYMGFSFVIFDYWRVFIIWFGLPTVVPMLLPRSTKHIHLLVYLTAGTLGLKYGPVWKWCISPQMDPNGYFIRDNCDSWMHLRVSYFRQSFMFDIRHSWRNNICWEWNMHHFFAPLWGKVSCVSKCYPQ